MYCGQTVGRIKMKLGKQVGLGPGHIVLEGDSAPSLQKRPNGWMDQDGTEVDLGQGDIVLDGDPASPPHKGHSPQFSAHVCCGQTAGWIKIPLGMEVGLGPGDFVLDGDPASPLKRGHAPHRSAHVYCG